MYRIQIASILIVFFVIAAGCVQPVQQLGCCLKGNATNTTGGGCVLYNMSDYQEYNYIDQTHSCDDSSQNTTGQCNVTIGSQTQLIPICTETQFQKCISGDCIAMACGDFAYNPRIGPGFSSVEDATGNIPPNLEDENQVANFYKARCKYLPMDERFKQIMKNAKAQVNVFRFGIGSSFDEYEQYKDYFPISDKFCGRNPPSSLMVDRYQNYLTSDLTAYNPVREITINCLSEMAYGAERSPFSFEETNATVRSLSAGIDDFSPLNPDQRGYKLAYKATVNFENATIGGSLLSQRVDFSKSLDTSFYKKYLYSINANQMYGLDGSDPAKGTFECNAEGNDCYSGNCDTSKYSRGTMFSTTTPGFTPREAATDCFKAKDSSGKERIVCAPTKNIVPDGTSPGIVSIEDVPVEYASAHFETPNNGRSDDWFFADARATVASLPILDSSSTASYHWMRIQRGDGASYNIGPTLTSENIPIPVLGATVNGPPAGGAMFFGKLNDSPMIYTWADTSSGTEIIRRDVVIGYALASSEAEFNNMYLARECRLGPNDYKMIEIDDPDGTVWGDLVAQFKPYINDRFNSMKTSGDGCGAYADMGDLIMSSLPWVLSYNKENGNSDEDARSATYLTSTIAQTLRDRNILDQPMVTTQSETVCAMKSNRMVPYGDDEREWMPDPDDWRTRYNVYYSKKIFLILYTPGTNMIGSAGGCAIDNETYLPIIRTYGWCESCSQATLAYQKLTAANPYQPAYITTPQNPTTANNRESLCTNTPFAISTSRTDSSGMLTYDTTWVPNIFCENNRVADIKDFNGQILANGTPRTSPNAATIKQRLGTYMKQGVMPVLDLTDSSNWNLTYQNGTVSDGIFTTPVYSNYSRYDFESLFGSMGTLVVIVDNVSGTANAQKVSQIINRSALLKQKCYGCLSAIHINNPANESEFRTSIDSVLTNPIANFNIDLITYDYQISTHDPQFSSISDPQLRSQTITNQITEISRTALLARRKSTMLVGLNLGNGGSMWNNRSNDEILFGTILGNENKLVTAGLIGIIYSPVRANASSSNGIINVENNLGIANDKFCALEKGVERLSSQSEISVFSKIASVNQVNCTQMTEIERSLRLGTTVDPMLCDNGVRCTLQLGIRAENAKCPDNTIVDLAAPSATIGEGGIINPSIEHTCRLCNETSGSYTCTYDYSNGTTSTITGRINTLSSDTQMEIIAGLPKPNKCCLEDQSGIRYSYGQKTQQASSSRPIVYPKDGNPNTDCGFGSAADIAQIGNFCGIRLPVADYKINCTVS
ncbi:MAG: hypothetical protein ACP5N9_01400 [Candidatus Bilamarchaeum sp.]